MANRQTNVFTGSHGPRSRTRDTEQLSPYLRLLSIDQERTLFVVANELIVLQPKVGALEFWIFGGDHSIPLRIRPFGLMQVDTLIDVGCRSCRRNEVSARLQMREYIVEQYRQIRRGDVLEHFPGCHQVEGSRLLVRQNAEWFGDVAGKQIFA